MTSDSILGHSLIFLDGANEADYCCLSDEEDGPCHRAQVLPSPTYPDRMTMVVMGLQHMKSAVHMNLPSTRSRARELAMMWQPRASAAAAPLSTVASTSTAPDADQLPVTLYQYSICPFCHRAKALLAYSQTPYKAVEVNPLTRQEIRWSKEYKKVPIMTIGSDRYFGSDKIVSGLLQQPAVLRRLQERWENGRTTKETFSKSESSTRWIAFSDDELAPLLYPNMCRTWWDAYAAFGYVNHVPEFNSMQRFAIRGIGSLAMYMAASRVKKKRGITDERKALDDALSILETEGLGAGNSFLSSGPDPDLGDLTVYATLRSIEGLPAHVAAVHQRGGPISEWYDRMKTLVEH